MFHTLALAACGCSCVCNSVLKQCSAVGRLSHFSSRSQPPSENDLYRSRVADGETTNQLLSSCSPKSQQHGFPHPLPSTESIFCGGGTWRGLLPAQTVRTILLNLHCFLQAFRSTVAWYARQTHSSNPAVSRWRH